MRSAFIGGFLTALVLPIINAGPSNEGIDIHLSDPKSIDATSTGAQDPTTGITTGQLGNATVVENNSRAVYVATLPSKSFFNPEDPTGNIKGEITATGNPDGIGVQFEVKFSNLPTSGGPFVYHLHVNPVPGSGNCTETLGHVDPFIRGETPACDSALPQTCQVGDLSGKHGAITSDPFVASYLDYFASTEEGLGSYFGNRSFVIHFANITRITCANFKRLPGKTNGTFPNATMTSGPAMVTTNSAKSLGVSLIAIFGLMMPVLGMVSFL